MSDERTASVEVDIRRAVDELTGLIESRYPSASLVRPGVDDPDATYITAMVDIDDPDEVMDLVVDRLLELQLAAGLLVYVLPIHPPARAARTRWRHEQAPAAAPLPLR